MTNYESKPFAISCVKRGSHSRARKIQMSKKWQADSMLFKLEVNCRFACLWNVGGITESLIDCVIRCGGKKIVSNATRLGVHFSVK